MYDRVIGSRSGSEQALTVQGDLVIEDALGAGAVFTIDVSALTFTLDTVDLRLGDNDFLQFGDAQDLTITWDGTNLKIAQATVNSGIQLGVSGAGIDLQLFGDTAGRDVLWDQSDDALEFADNAKLSIGTGADIVIAWNATSLAVTQATPDSAILLGVSGAGIDLQFYGDTATRDLIWDQSADSLIFNDSALLVFGTGSDVTARFDGTDFDVLAAADDTIIKFGTGTNSFDIWIYGNIATAYLDTDASASLVRLNGPMRLSGFNRLSPRYELKWVAGARGKPGINADINSATESVREIADPDFEILGVNGVSASTAYNTAGGITLTTAGAEADEVILVPHLDTSQSAWGTVVWPTSKELYWEAIIATGANITNVIIWAGLKLTNTEVLITDADQVFFRYEDDVTTGNWIAVDSIANTDVSTDTAVTVGVSTVYHLAISIDSSRVATMYLDGVLKRTTTALTSANLIPYIGVACDGGAGAAKALTVYGQTISRAL